MRCQETVAFASPQSGWLPMHSQLTRCTLLGPHSVERAQVSSRPHGEHVWSISMQYKVCLRHPQCVKHTNACNASAFAASVHCRPRRHAVQGVPAASTVCEAHKRMQGQRVSRIGALQAQKACSSSMPVGHARTKHLHACYS